MLNYSPAHDEYEAHLWQVATVGSLNPLGFLATKTYAGYYGQVQMTGLAISYLVDGEVGVDHWMRASNNVFRNRTFISKLPVIGEYISILPNPIGVAETVWNSAEYLVREIKDLF